MSIDLPGPLEEVLSLVGVPWVYIEEDDLHALARNLRAYAADLRHHRDAAGQRLAQTGADTKSESYEALVAHYASMSSGHMEEACRIPEDMGTGLDVAGDAVKAIKIGIIAALSTAATAMAADALATVLTLGAAAAAEAAIVATARTVIENLVSQLEQEAVAKIIDEVFGSLIGELKDRMSTLVYQGVEQLTAS